jgi:hypothetical protein
VPSNWNPVVAQQSLGESTLRKNVLPIKGDDNHLCLHSSARVVIQQVADAVLYRAGESNSFRQRTFSEVLISLLNDRILVCPAIESKAGLTVISNKVVTRCVRYRGSRI